MDCAGSFFLGQTDRFADGRGDIGPVNDLAGIFRDGSHHLDDIDDLELRLFAFFDGLLARNHHHRHGAELGIRSGRHEIGRARSERRKADTDSSGESSDRRCHESGALFVARDDELDVGVPKTFEQVQVLFTRDPEYVLDALALERLHHQI